MKETTLKDGVDQNNLIQQPFTKKYLDEQREETGNEILPIRINPAERETIDFIKNSLNYGNDSKAIKASLIIAKNVIQNMFGADLMRKLTDENRRRPLSETPKTP